MSSGVGGNDQRRDEQRTEEVAADESGAYSGEDESGGHPLVFENPDGSFHHALPTGVRYKRPRVSDDSPGRLDVGIGLNEWVIWDPLLLQQIERVYNRHERVFLIFIFLQFLLENSFNALLIKHKEDTVGELLRAYPFLSVDGGVVAASAVWERRSVRMKFFSDLAIAGILGQIIFAYINRFNLILFFFRFIVFAYSRFLHSILAGTARIVIATNSNAPILIDV
jgi:hypothetical protein